MRILFSGSQPALLNANQPVTKQLLLQQEADRFVKSPMLQFQGNPGHAFQVVRPSSEDINDHSFLTSIQEHVEADTGIGLSRSELELMIKKGEIVVLTKDGSRDPVRCGFIEPLDSGLPDDYSHCWIRTGCLNPATFSEETETQIFNTLKEMAKEKGCMQLSINVPIDPEHPATRFYESQGFKDLSADVYDVEPHIIRIPSVGSVAVKIMELNLNAAA